jgi:aspartate 1-decarboxylase
MQSQRTVLRAKIHKATVTQASVDYIGSITIDKALMERIDLWPGEQVLVVDNTNGARLTTYAIEGERDSGIIGMNGAAAHLIHPGDEIIIIAFEQRTTPNLNPINILVDKQNRFERYL